MLHADLIKHGPEFCRALANRHFAISDSGIYFPKQRAIVQGVFETRVNGRDLQIDPNVVPTEALNYLLKTGLKTAAGVYTAWYIAPFLNNVTPGATLTAATFESVVDEFTQYDETTRVAWTLPSDPTSGSYSNSASPAAFTAASAVGTGAGVDVYGAGILSASAKESTAAKLLCASKFSAARNLKATDVLTVIYTVSATSTS
jgi:hypothetical protein